MRRYTRIAYIVANPAGKRRRYKNDYLVNMLCRNRFDSESCREVETSRFKETGEKKRAEIWF